MSTKTRKFSALMKRFGDLVRNRRKSMSVYRWLLLGFVSTSVGAVVLVGPNASVRASADDDSDSAICSGGSIAAGVYKNLKISGACTVDAGSVTVERNLTARR